MNETDIKKCIKNGYCWCADGARPVKLHTDKWSYNSEHIEARSLCATKREAQAAIDARNAEIESPEQLDARLKATYEGYCNAGGPITKEQLTDEMRVFLYRNNYRYWTGFQVDGISPYKCVDSFLVNVSNVYHPCPLAAQLEHGSVFWNKADAEHDHFLRTWKGPLTEEVARQLRTGDKLWHISTTGCYSPYKWNNSLEQHGWCKRRVAFLSKSEAKAAAHDLWLADCRENQIEPITEAQRRMLYNDDDVVQINYRNRPYIEAVVFGQSDWSGRSIYFSAKAAQAALDKAKQPEAGDKPSQTETVKPTREQQIADGWTDEEIKRAALQPRECTDIPQPLAPRNDPVNHPAHYTSSPSGIECIQVTEWMGFLLGNAVKYIWRAGSKGNEKQDLEKAVWYIQRRIEQIEKEEVK